MLGLARLAPFALAVSTVALVACGEDERANAAGGVAGAGDGSGGAAQGTGGGGAGTSVGGSGTGGQQGGGWESIECGTIATLERVSGTSSTDIWLSGCGNSESILAHWDGTTCAPSGNIDRCVADIWARGPDDLWVLKYQEGSVVTEPGSVVSWPSDTLVQQFGVPHPYAIRGAAPNDVWVGTESGAGIAPLQHFDGSSWAPVDTGATYAVESLSPLGPNDLWALWGDGGVPSGGHAHHYSGGIWEAGSVDSLRAVWAVAPDDVWAVGIGGVTARFDGSTWTSVPSPTVETLDVVWGLGPNDVWAGGGEVVIHWDGTAWTVSNDPEAPPCLSDIWGTSASDVWAVCRGKTDVGLLFHWKG